jgi:hypothetical protein
MKLTVYEKVLTFAKEKIQEAMAPVRAREMKKKAELEMAKIEGRMIEQEAKIQELASAYPIDYDRMISAIDELALLERRKKQFGVIVAEMFPA